MPDAPSPPVVLVTGASGFVGARVAAAMRARGWRVRGLARRDWTGEPELPPADRVLCDVARAIPPEALAGVRAVVHCAALTTPGSEARAREVNVLGTLALARAAGGARFVFVSSQSARADAPTAYGRTKHEAETSLLAMKDLDVVVVRPGLVVGAGTRGLFARLRALVRRLPVVPVVGGNAPVQPIHVDDLAEALARCVKGTVARGSVLRLGDPRALTLRQLLERVAIAECGRRKPMISVPVGLVLPFVAAAEALRLPVPVGAESLRALRGVEAMETSADLARLGLALRPLDDAIRG